MSGETDCAKCGLVKPYAYCKPCHTAVQRVLRLKKFFNITLEEYNQVLEFQNGVCAICKQPPKKMRLNVDHDHKSGLIRGLLCPWCNRVIGLFRDSKERFEEAVKYLGLPPATEVFKTPRFGLKGRVSNKAATRNRLNKDLAGMAESAERYEARKSLTTNGE